MTQFAGSNKERQEVGDPGHCERCAEVGHVKAHPSLGCGDVGCYSYHDESPDTYEEKVVNPDNRAMRAASGRIDDSRPLVQFLYLLQRDHLPTGVVEEIIRKIGPGSTQFTNGWLTKQCQYHADILLETK